MAEFSCSGQIVNLEKREIFPGTVFVKNGKIEKIQRDKKATCPGYILPGFIDSHIHVESSMLPPSEFARLASIHGTVGVVTDPHEIANVLGIKGIRFMIENGKQVPFHFYFGASSCVPATSFETAGAQITAADIESLFQYDGLLYLSEMMNFPGVLSRDPEIMKKIETAKKMGRPIDGHAPGLKGKEAGKYSSAGIATDHECFTLQEALDKINYGMHILIREGSAAKNYAELHPLLKRHPERVMFCCDDKHPHELAQGHIDQIVKRSIVQHDYDLFDVLRAACYNPVKHYKLDTGLLRPGDSADFIVVDNLKNFQVLETYVQGKQIAKDGKSAIHHKKTDCPNQFFCSPKKPKDFLFETEAENIRVIVASDGQLITQSTVLPAKKQGKRVVSDLKNDLLKLTVVNRYQDAKPAIGFIQNFGLKKGAIASSIAHDSHNIVAVGCSDEELAVAVNLVIQNKGGISAVSDLDNHILPLPIAGLMSDKDCSQVIDDYLQLEKFAKQLGSELSDPFMTLSFMALLVIPELKLSDKGLFDGKAFQFIPVAVD